MANENTISMWKQFGAALDMFQNAIEKCPDELWNSEDREYKFWYWTYHTLFWTDYYLDTDPKNWDPPEPYGLTEFDPEGVMPDTVYTKEQLKDYAEHCRAKLRKLMKEFDSDPGRMDRGWSDDSRSYPMYEMTLYNMRHVQHHTGQLNMLLGQIDHDLPKWVSQTKLEL